MRASLPRPARFWVRPGVELATGGVVTYVHIMFDGHRLVRSEGAVTESFYPGETGLSTLDDAARDELFALFPELIHGADSFGPMAYPALSMREATALLRAS